MIFVLAFRTPCVYSIWKTLQQSNKISELANLSTLTTNELLYETEQLLLLWMKLYSWLLSTLDDDEFFQQQSLTTSELPQLIVLLKVSSTIFIFF